MIRIFMSYRRSDAAAAGRIYDYLESRLGHSAIFKDIYTISGGENFHKQLYEALHMCLVMLVVIGQNCLQAMVAKVNRRLVYHDDCV